MKYRLDKDDLRDVLYWTGTRNHAKIEGLDHVREAMSRARGNPPKYGGWLKKEAWGWTVVEFEATEEEMQLVMKALCVNPSMEDSQGPRRAIYALKCQGVRYPSEVKYPEGHPDHVCSPMCAHNDWPVDDNMGPEIDDEGGATEYDIYQE